MSIRSCFVIMPIGEQSWQGGAISASDLRQRFDDLIKQALLAAEPGLDVIRADDVAIPGTITTDIITRIMHSDLVIADVTYPNPNVFYELGLRHGCRNGTLIIRDKNGPDVPFDISHLRHISYENTPTGLKSLSQSFRNAINFMNQSSDSPDNHLQEMAKLTGYSFPKYGVEQTNDPQLDMMLAMISSPDMLELFERKSKGEEIDSRDFAKAMISNPQLAATLTKAMFATGKINLFPDLPKNQQRRIPASKQNHKRRK